MVKDNRKQLTISLKNWLNESQMVPIFSSENSREEIKATNIVGFLFFPSHFFRLFQEKI